MFTYEEEKNVGFRILKEIVCMYRNERIGWEIVGYMWDELKLIEKICF